MRQYGLEKRSIVIEFGGLGYGHDVQGFNTLIEERVQKIICHSREIGVVQICAVRLNQFTSDIEFYIEVDVRVIIGGCLKL